MNVVSLFNGMGTLRQALSDLNIKVDKYYSSEIKPFAIELQQHHFPDVIQVGDINNWKEWNIDWSTIDFIGSGSPCQDLSIAGKRAGVVDGTRSNLFFTFIEILNHVKSLNPNVIFLQENVGSADIKDVGIMSRELGVYPVRINSNLVTAQNRDRYYWTNIRTKETMFDVVSDIPQPKDRGIMLNAILESGEVEKDKANAILESQSRPVTSQESIIKRDKKGFITAVKEVIQINESKESGGKQPFQQNRIYDSRGLFPALCTSNNGNVQTKDEYRQLTQTELERLQGFKDGYTSILKYNQAASLLGDGWTLPIIIHILSFMTNNAKECAGKKEKSVKVNAQKRA